MNHAIEHELIEHPYLITSGKKRSLKHQLIRVISGLVLLRLGNREYAIETDESVWLPFDCLASWTFFPASQIERVCISSRNKLPLPTQAGYITHTPLSQSLLDKLAHSNLSVPHQKEILQLLKREIADFKPSLYTSHLSESINQWKPDHESNLSRTEQLVLTIRESQKRLKSGKNLTHVVDALFNGNTDEFLPLYQLVTGETVDSTS